jgi:hypothetical protein
MGFTSQSKVTPTPSCRIIPLTSTFTSSFAGLWGVFEAYYRNAHPLGVGVPECQT